MRGVRISLMALALAVTGGLVSQPRDALACGGFFCSQNAPVNQAAERIIFVDNGDDTVTAVIQILYEGPSEDFSWVLPVPGEPTPTLSSNIAFQRLQAATNPQYILQTEFEGDCQQIAFASGADTGTTDVNSPGGGVTVVAEGTVGPFDWRVISVDPETTDAADAAVTWLEDNGYDVTALGADVLRPYLEADMNLLAFKLVKGSDAGEIRPVVITYPSDCPMIPIVPTAVAANDDMGVMAFVVGASRAVPVNYKHLVINEALINWFNANSNYNDVINLAANEAGGQGFVTELAASTIAYGEVIFSTIDEANWALFVSQDNDWTEREGSLLNDLSFQYAAFDGYRMTMREHVPLPEGVTLQELLDCMSCYYGYDDSVLGIEVEAFLLDFEENVIQPLRDTQSLLSSQPYLTRLYTTMSASEMTLDPVFDFNADLPDFPNVHTATRTVECTPEQSQFDAPWRMNLPQGGMVRGEGTNWPFSATSGQPANLLVEQLTTEGVGNVVTDNTVTIQQALVVHNETIRPSGQAGDDSGCGCSSAPSTTTPSVLTAMLALGLLWRRRRAGQTVAG